MPNQRARQLRRNPTQEERIVWQKLRYRRLAGYRFRRQHRIGPFIVDFVCLERKLIVEIDGCQHGGRAEEERDRKRAQWLEQKGFRIVRIWNRDVRLDLHDAVESIFRALIGES